MREYKECYIAFLDLLGFKSLIEDKEKTCEDIAKVFDKIGEESIITTKENRPLMDFTKLKKKIMSDSICLYVKSSVNNSLAGLIAACNHLQVKLLCRKTPILLRGAIIKGEIYAEGDITFGPGVSRAYLLEEKAAKYPRIILSKNLIDEWETHDSHGEKLSRRTLIETLMHFMQQIICFFFIIVIAVKKRGKILRKLSKINWIRK